MITVLVEGRGDKRALPFVVQRERGRISVQCVDMNGRSNIVRHKRGFEDTVRRQHAQGKRSFMVLLDGDVTCAPYGSLQEEQADMPRRAERLGQELGVRVRVCWAVLEMESWLIGGIRSRATYCGLKRVGQIPANTEAEPPDPKRWLEDHLRSDYTPEIQECLARHVDLQEAKRRNQSMRTFFNNIP